MSYLDISWGAFLASWCKLTAYNSWNHNLSIENQAGMIFYTVLYSNFSSYRWCNSIFIWVLPYKMQVLNPANVWRSYDCGTAVWTYVKTYSVSNTINLSKHSVFENWVNVSVALVSWENTKSDVVYSHSMTYRCDFTKKTKREKHCIISTHWNKSSRKGVK